jgi:hypothetical protein
VYKFKNSLMALLGVITLIVITTVLMPHIGYGSSGTTANAPSSQTQNVNVVNTPTVNAQQSGTWNVGINGTPTVRLDAANNTVKIDAATPVSVRDVDNPARQPFADATSVSVEDGQFSGSGTLAPVPSGKILVLEQISVVARLTGQKLLAARIEGPSGLRYYLMPNDQGTDVFGRNVFITSQHVRLYFTAGQQVSCTAERSGTAGPAVADFSVSGYFVDEL